MEPIVLNPKSKREYDFQLLAKLNIPSRRLTREEREDLGMANLMRDVDRSKKVSKASIMGKLAK
ncbi:MAG: hypothetical protein ACK5V5_08270 [Cyclobacteriaceae bacterium]|jgi:hypothetical protein|nr:hypothetical protein [Flammeovirgaceae bacterium]